MSFCLSDRASTAYDLAYGEIVDMRMKLWRASVAVPVLVVGLAPVASARPDRPDVKSARAPGIAKPVGAPAAGVTLGSRATTIMGTAWAADNTPIRLAHLRLRNLVTGRVEATTISNDAGQFAFDNVEGGNYVVELLNEAGKVQVVGHAFTIAPGETVATFVRAGTKVPWFNGFFGNSVSAVSSTAASEGITAIAPVTRAVSAKY